MLASAISQGGSNDPPLNTPREIIVKCIKFSVPTNPCPCGNYPDCRKCSCTEQQICRYQSKVSGPLLGRIDIRMGEVKGANMEFVKNDSNKKETSTPLKP